MEKSALLAAIQKEIHRHGFSLFIDEPQRSRKAARA
jgi:hypothetical protein